ncbi:MAG: dual specificity protein phosphatase family protein [Sedimentisphaerales bacterium]|nr:dual specificity protein phosphatase family protein [Sedimentisphaerales bacterium]
MDRLTLHIVLYAGSTVFMIAGCDKKTNEAVDPNTVTPATKLNLPGCPNAYQVSDILYRGAQPSAEGFKQLEKQGIKTVLNLRWMHSDRDELKGTNLDYIHIEMQAWDPEQDQIEEFLKIITDPAKHPVFVHCQHGADRTGAMVAVYRIVVQGWTKEQALKEMTEGPFGFHTIWKDLPKCIGNLDIRKLRNKFNIPEPSNKEAERVD